MERQKIRDLTRQANDLFRAESRSELIRETIRETILELPDIRPMKTPPSKHGDKTLVVGIGDFHYGAKIYVEGLHGEVINRYDSSVFEERMWKLHQEIVEICEKENIGEVCIFMVGDLIDGMLRQSQLMKLEYGVIESTMYLSEFLCRWIASLSSFVENVCVMAASGNHSEVRPLRSKKGEFEDENLEKIIMWYLEARLKNIEGIFIEPECNKMMLINVRGFDILLLHGDGEKKIEQIARDCINQYHKAIDFFICGHKHRESELPSGMTANGDGVIVRVPSICGVDSYANSKGYSGKPGATAMVIEEGYGRRCVYPIQL